MFRLVVLIILLTSCGRFISSQKMKRQLKSNPPGTVHLKDNIYIDKTEIANVHYREFLFWIARNDSIHYEEYLPDTLVWRSDTLYNEDLVEVYFRHPGYNMYPAVGISYDQAVDFCKWRTDRVNEFIQRHPDKRRKYKKVLYRLPSEEEWTMAAADGLDINSYPFGMAELFDKKNRLKIYCNRYLDKRIHDKHPSEPLTANTYSFYPNNLGIYQLQGNMSEMINEKGKSKGGNYLLPLNSCKIEMDHFYSGPQAWLGFRCVCEIVE